MAEQLSDSQKIHIAQSVVFKMVERLGQDAWLNTVNVNLILVGCTPIVFDAMRFAEETSYGEMPTLRNVEVTSDDV